MPYNVTFNITDSNSNVLGCAALLDEFTTAEFGAGTLTNVEGAAESLILSFGTSTYSKLNTTKVKFIFKSLIGSTNVAVAEFEIKDTVGGDDLCSGGTPTSRSSMSAGYTADKAVDNDNATLWNEDFIANSSWWAYEFASAVDLAEYTIRARGSYVNDSPTSWDIYIWSSEESDWVLVGSESTSADWTGLEVRTFDFPLIPNYETSGNKISSAVDVGSYGTSAPDLKIKWDATVPAGTTLTIETGISGSNSTPPSTWYQQANGSSITNLPADLTGKYLYYRANLATTNGARTPKLEWVVVYDGSDAPTAAARVEFNGETKTVSPAGAVVFTSVDAGTDLPYTVYALALDGADIYENIWPDGFADTVTIVDADVIENVSIVIPNAVVTQQYIEVACYPTAPPDAVVTQQYIEVAYVEGGATPEDPGTGNFTLYLGTTPISAIYFGGVNITDVILGG